MIPEIKAQFTEDILNEAIQRYDIEPGDVRSLGGFESFVYEYAKNGKSYVLKITHTIRRTVDYIMGELEWLNHLADQGITVARAIPSAKGQWIEEIPKDQGSFLVISYEKARGNAISTEVWNESLFEAWGELIGNIHRATKKYEVSSAKYKRQAWEVEEQLRAETYLMPNDVMIDILKERVNRLRLIPQTRDTYGLVHADLHQKNFYLDGQNMHVFDFDDCHYTYFINDIGITLYYALWYPAKKYENKEEYYRTFFHCFMRGYLKQNTVTVEEVSYLHDFMKIRHTLLYIILHQTSDITTLNPEQLKIRAQHQSEIVTEEPLLPIDFVYEFTQIHN
ncbi:aminoglycoside phosphotransferase [Paenibacillus selenitireducens]|uniref:Aminoglycoside phosphotransferase n=1 Tax=Paenibacillus selenitireducens TaxID=1324314 RepID=A0A1T2X1P2_9BACL|nr:phosphotransferase [Paenibacillus selenitireducens]OPA73772.1 aminoglycoside phosphotransferase [Paenibacillus selenitireducens]